MIGILYTEDHPHTEEQNYQHNRVHNLDSLLADFLRKARGAKTYAAFAKDLGIGESTLYRLIHGQQSATLEKVDQILKRLRLSLRDVFGSEVDRTRSRRD